MHIRNDVVISKNKFSKNKPWLVRYWGKFDPMKEKKPRYSKSFATKKQAERFAQSLRDDIDDGISVEKKNNTLGLLCKKVIEAKEGSVQPTSLKTYTNTVDRLIKYFGSHRNVKTITKEDAEKFLSDIALIEDNAEPSDSTRAKHYRNARMIFNKFLDWGYIRTNVFKGISLGKIKTEDWHCITPKEFNKLLQTIDNIAIRKNKDSNITEKQDLHNKMMLKAFYILMNDCGLRFGEAINLLWTNGNIDFINRCIHIKNRQLNILVHRFIPDTPPLHSLAQILLNSY